MFTSFVLLHIPETNELTELNSLSSCVGPGPACSYCVLLFATVAGSVILDDVTDTSVDVDVAVTEGTVVVVNGAAIIERC